MTSMDMEPTSYEQAKDVETALYCAEKAAPDEVGSWPTVAGVLAAEVRRLREALAVHDGF